MKKLIYILWFGENYSEGYMDTFYYTTKKAAETHIRKLGYKWNSEQGFFTNDDIGYWVKIISVTEYKD